MSSVQSSVTRTASDAVLAKCSAISAGHKPVATCFQEYQNSLQRIASLTTNSSKRQTPLVNAGYAARIASITAALERFLSFHQEPQVVMLGCGFDILGVWCHSLARKNITVYEVDCLEICLAKRDALASSGLLRIVQADSDKPDAIRIEGIVDRDSQKPRDSSSLSIPNYHLLSADLRELPSLECLASKIHKSRPTLVLTELVLAYLGKDNSDALLQYCSTRLCIEPNSVLVAYEPLGSEATRDSQSVSVAEGYNQTYTSLFVSTLERGNAKPSAQDDTDVYHTLGTNCAHVEKRLRAQGFGSCHACLAGTAAANACTMLSPPELFDEHAALALHLQSYVVAHAFSSGSTLTFQLKMCPWSQPLAKQNAVSFETESGITLRPIQAAHQDQVRALFQQTYEELGEAYPPVKKMVKTALKTDLSVRREAALVDVVGDDSSTIGCRYCSWGGIFIVAMEQSSVVGCVGVRPFEKTKESDVRGFGKNSFELHRLAVDPSRRGRGIGKNLLLAAVRFATVVAKKDASYKLVASTPAMLTAANELYKTCGFSVQEEIEMGIITMRTYLKEIVK